MKTLYTRIVFFSAVIVFISFVCGVFLANIAHNQAISSHYEQKMEKVGQALSHMNSMLSAGTHSTDEALSNLAELGYQLYLVDPEHHVKTFGRPFKHADIASKDIDSVLTGNTYLGMLKQGEWSSLFVPAIFENRLALSHGIPLVINGERHALFIRPDMVQQTEEVRVLIAVLLISTFVISLVLISVKTRYLVKPLQRLTRATMELEKGNYEVKLDLHRNDEIGELARRFTVMAGALGQLDSVQKQFVANVSHEIQSPLTSIQGLAQQLMDHPLPPEQERRYLHIIAEESRRLSGISRQLLTLASLERGKEMMKQAPIRLDEQLREVIILLEPQWGIKDMELNLQLDQVIWIGDAGLLHQAWTNLLTNAIKFTAPQGTITVRCHQQGEDIIIVVSDTGRGIPQDVLPHIFERFYKYNEHVEPGQAQLGTGLGLAIVKRIIELHNGTISALSESGKGTTFTVRLAASDKHRT
ncbi:HAMP domain-containing sensor histidine kinase [Paenibacillus sp. S-12]|uniref:sensor histidine kinase n=1 Tax=unclassified Paenibacillus TaxID=185978 RepID=UPI0025A24E8C|nr:HAMP domain-containing sensor histidine kinase [Paenibacillus sp. S-12]